MTEWILYLYPYSKAVHILVFYELPDCILLNTFNVRFIGSTPVDLQTQLSTEEGGGGTISEVGSDILLADPDDDYQPLDPAYLPPGLEDEAKCEKVGRIV